MRLSRSEVALIAFIVLFGGFLAIKTSHPFAAEQARGALLDQGYRRPIIVWAPPTEGCPQSRFRYTVTDPYFETGFICAGSLLTVPTISPTVRIRRPVL